MDYQNNLKEQNNELRKILIDLEDRLDGLKTEKMVVEVSYPFNLGEEYREKYFITDLEEVLIEKVKPFTKIQELTSSDKFTKTFRITLNFS